MTLPAVEILGLVLGLLFGSFLNVCIARMPRGESVIHPGSHCLACNHPIRWFDNVPLLSWLLLQGRCRDCHAKISWQYPVIELAPGLWFATAGYLMWNAWIAQGSIQTVRPFDQGIFATFAILGFATLGFLLIGLIVIDWQTQRLPDVFTLSGITIGLFLICLQAIFLGPKDDQIVLNTTHQLRISSPGSFAARGNVFLTGPENLIFGRMAAIVGAALILLIVRWSYRALRKRDGLGLGDVKMLAMIAAFLGFWPAVLSLFLGVLLASAYALILLLRRRATALTRLPLGSFLGLGGLLTALFGEAILTWYRSLLV